MNQLAVLILTLIFSNTYQIQTQKPKTVKENDTTKAVSAIKTQFLAIDAKRKTYIQYEPDFKGKAPEGLLLTGFYEGQEMRMLNSNIYTDGGKTEADQYLNPTGVFMIYAKVYEYESPLSVNPRTKIKSMTENWYYFKNEELIKYVLAGKVVPGGSEEFNKVKAAYKEEFKRNKALFSDFSKLKRIK